MEVTTLLTLVVILILTMIGWKTLKKLAKAIDDMIKVSHQGVKFGLTVATSAIATGEVNNEFKTSKNLGKLLEKISKAENLSDIKSVKEALKAAQAPKPAPTVVEPIAPVDPITDYNAN